MIYNDMTVYAQFISASPKTCDVKKWIGSDPDVIKEKCNPLEIIPASEIDSYIWVQKDI